MAERTVILVDALGNRLGTAANPLVVNASGMSGSGIYVSSISPSDPVKNNVWLDTITDSIWYWSSELNAWIETASGTGTAGIKAIKPVTQNCLVSWYDGNGNYVKNAAKGAYVPYGLFVSMPYGLGTGEYQLKVYAQTDTNTYGGIVNMDGAGSYPYTCKLHPRLGFVANMQQSVLSSEFGGGMVIFGTCNDTSIGGDWSRLFLAVKPKGGTSYIEALQVYGDGICRAKYGLEAKYANIQSGQTYNINGSPHAHSQYLLKAGDTMQGILDMGMYRIINVATPVNGGDSVNLDYVSGLVGGITYKDPVLDIVSVAPASPADNSRYIVAVGATGTFAGHDKEIATYISGGWAYETAQKGWTVNDVADGYNYNYNGSAWVKLQATLSHLALTHLDADSHPNYVHISIPRTITATHAFNNASMPFTVSCTEMVSNLNAQYWQGHIPSEYAQVSHTHTFATLTDFYVSSPASADTLQYDPYLNKFVNGTPFMCLTIDSKYQFDTIEARDTYFTVYPAELTDGLLVTVADLFYQWRASTSTWLNRTAILRGKDGADGAAGKDGADGAKGDKGDKGDTGDTGAKGDKGDQGNPGSTITLKGSVVASSSLPASATVNDAYYVSSEGVWYAWAEGYWVNVGSPVTEKGEKGDRGDKGEKGDTGSKGDKGDTGATGADGAQGPQGEQGIQGEPGLGSEAWGDQVESIATRPPTNYDVGDRFCVASNPDSDGAFYGHANDIAKWLSNASWEFTAPEIGWAVFCYNLDIPIYFTGVQWKPLQGAVSSVAWGAIKGTLLDQTDLAAALAGKANLTHTHTASNDLTDVNITSRTGGEIWYLDVLTNKWTSLAPASITDAYLHSNGAGYAPNWQNPLTNLKAMQFKGVIDCSTNPNYPAASSGDVYIVSVAGKIGGSSGTAVSAKDMLVCVTTSAAGTQAEVGSNWSVISGAVTGTVTGPTSSVNGNFASFNGTTGQVIQDSGYGPNSFQPLDSDLTHISALSGHGLLRRNADGTWYLDTSTYLTSYTPAIATASAAGVVIVGDGLTVTASGRISAAAQPAVKWATMAGFTATPTNTYTIAMSTDYTSTITPGMCLRYKIGGIYYYGTVTTIISTAIVIAGAPLTGTITELAYADANRTVQVDYFVSGKFSDSADDNLLANDMNTAFQWNVSEARLVQILVRAQSADTGATQPKVNISVAGNKVCSSNSLAGLAVASGTWTKTIVDINTTNYVVTKGNAVEITVDNSGTNKDAQHLTVSGVYILV